MGTLRKEYRDLEMKVLRQLRELVENSNYVSELIGEKALKVNLFDYNELILINDRLTFIDTDGLQYSLTSDASLEDLIDIINQYETNAKMH